MRRFDPGYVDLKARLDAGEIGAPLLMHCAHRNVSVHDFFDSAMIITDSAVHEVDVARWLLDDEIARVTVLAPRPTTARAGSATRSCSCSRPPGDGSSTSRRSSARATATTSAARSWGRTGRSSCSGPPRSRRARGADGTRSPPTSEQRFATAYSQRAAGLGRRHARGRAPGTATPPPRSPRPRVAVARDRAPGRRPPGLTPGAPLLELAHDPDRQPEGQAAGAACRAA